MCSRTFDVSMKLCQLKSAHFLMLQLYESNLVANEDNDLLSD